MKKGFTGLKDADREILLKLSNDRDLLEKCSLDKYFQSICDENFYNRRLQYKYPDTHQYKPEDMKWKRYFLRVIYYIAKLQEDHKFIYKTGDPKIYYEILSMKNKYQRIHKASKYGYLDLIENLIEKEVVDIDENFFLFLHGACGAAESNKRDLLDYFINKVKNNFLDSIHLINNALGCAVRNGNREQIEYIISKGVNNFVFAMDEAIKKGDKELIQYLIDNGANDWDNALFDAIINDNKDLIQFFIDKGGNLNGALQIAVEQDDELLINKVRALM